MKKVILYDAGGLYVISCQLVGVDECGEPQMVVMTPGLPVTSLEAYTEEAEIKKMKFLCEAGEEVPSSRVVRVLSPLIQFMDQFILRDLIEDMKSLGVTWNDKPVKLSAIILKSNDKAENRPYSLQILLFDNEGLLRFDNYFESYTETLECLSIFQRALKVKAGIPVKMVLNFTRLYKAEVPDKYKQMFEEINYPPEK